MAAIMVLPGCNFQRFDDDITGPEASPVCSISQFYVESAVLTTTHGGYISVKLDVNNGYGCAPAFNVHADITASGRDQVLGGNSVDFNVLHGGEFDGAYVDLDVSGVPDAMNCILSWEDDAGNFYSTGGAAGVFGAVLKSKPIKKWVGAIDRI
jgi:hypothetical protein